MWSAHIRQYHVWNIGVSDTNKISWVVPVFIEIRRKFILIFFPFQLFLSLSVIVRMPRVQVKIIKRHRFTEYRVSHALWCIFEEFGQKAHNLLLFFWSVRQSKISMLFNMTHKIACTAIISMIDISNFAIVVGFSRAALFHPFHAPACYWLVGVFFFAFGCGIQDYFLLWHSFEIYRSITFQRGSRTIFFFFPYDWVFSRNWPHVINMDFETISWPETTAFSGMNFPRTHINYM